MKKKAKEKLVVGWREWLALPDLGIPRIKAKVDTGARTSSIHADDIKMVRVRGKKHVRFTVLPTQRSTRGAIRVRAPFVEERKVRSSNGAVELRPVVRTHVQCGEESWEIELTLTSRDVMGFRMLLGRQAVRGHALVDPGRSFVANKPPKRRRRNTS